MKHILKKASALLLLLVLILSLSACANAIKGNEARDHVKNFFAEVAEGDFKEAKTYLHTDQTGDLEDFFNSLEQTRQVDFQDGIEIKRTTGVHISFYSSDVDGCKYELSMILTVSEKELPVTVTLVRNDNGFGIRNISFEAN